MADESLLKTLLAVPTEGQHVKRKGDPTTTVEVKGNVAEAELQGTPEAVTEDAARAELQAEGLNPADWKATGFRTSRWTMANGDEGVSRRFTFARVGSEGSGMLILPDLDDLHAQVQREDFSAPPVGLGGVTEVCVIADVQAGKVSTLGGTQELLYRLEESRARWIKRLEEIQPAEIVLVDNGDAIENFESGGSPDRTNDLQLTEQIRVWRRVFWTWINTAAQHAETVRVVSVPSNHCRVRRGKNPMGPPADDYGIEVLHQVADMAQVYPEKYAHLSFYAPQGEREAIAIEAAGGKILGFAHGHQVSNINGLAGWFANQALGRTEIGGADIAVFGHFHNLRIQTVGDDRWMFVAPTSDNGSAWFNNISGAESAPGVLAFVVDAGGWRNLAVC